MLRAIGRRGLNRGDYEMKGRMSGQPSGRPYKKHPSRAFSGEGNGTPL